MSASDTTENESRAAEGQASLIAIAVGNVLGSLPAEDQNDFWESVITFLNERYDGAGEDIRFYLDKVRQFIGDGGPKTPAPDVKAHF